MRAKGSFSPIFFFFFFLVSLSGSVQIGVLSKERGREEKKGGKERRRRGTNVGVNEGGRARERGESPRVALIRGPLHPPAYPSRREAIIFSAPKARYVSMRIRLYRSNANSDSTGSDLLSRIEDYDRRPVSPLTFSSHRRLKRCVAESRIEWRINQARNIPLRGYPRIFATNFLFSSSPSLRFHSRHVCSEKNCTPFFPLSLLEGKNSALVSWSLDKSRLTNERSFRLPAWRRRYFGWKWAE